jgi:hypothetical protein
LAQLLHSPLSDDPTAEVHREAYNAAFEELGLNWHWDSVTFACLPGPGRDALRAYLQTEHPHLLRAYDADFLADAIERTKARYYATMLGNRAAAASPRGQTTRPERTAA